MFVCPCVRVSVCVCVRHEIGIGTTFVYTPQLMLNFGDPKTGTFLLGGKISTIWLDSNYRVSCVGRLRLDRSTNIDFESFYTIVPKGATLALRV